MFKNIKTALSHRQPTFTLVLTFILHSLLPFPSTFLWQENEVGNCVAYFDLAACRVTLGDS